MPKAFRDDGRWRMAFAGDRRRLDDPTGIGVTYSDDLFASEKLPGSPVFILGNTAAFDFVPVASPNIRKEGGRYYMWYAGSDRIIAKGLHSQVGLAWVSETQ